MTPFIKMIKMKKILLLVTITGSCFAQTINLTAPITELRQYGADFTDTDGDGMSDVAEKKYGFDPHDKGSYPTKDYTFLSGNAPTLHESTGVTDPLNEIRFEFTESEYTQNRQGTSNLDKLKLDREFLNLAMPILLDELGVPPDSFIIKISCLNRGVYANGTRISIMDDSKPQSFIHEIGHVWKHGWNLSFMKLRGGKRSFFRGFEEGFSEALTYNICNKFAEAYPNHSLVKSAIATSKNAQTWRGDVYNFDVTLGEPSLRGGTFWNDRFTQYRYENSSGVFSVLANQRPGAMKDLLRVFYEEAEKNPQWDWTLNSNDIFELWEGVFPTINGIDTSDWLSRTGLLEGLPAQQRLYVSIIDYRVYLMYPNSQGNFSWSYDPNVFSVQNIPSWFPTKQVNGKVVPNVSDQPFNVEVNTIHGEQVSSSSRKLGTRGLGETSLVELYNDLLPIGLYKATIEFPTFKDHTSDYKHSSYVMGTKHIVHSKDELTLHVGIDIPTASKVEMKINDLYYTTDLVNGLAVFRFNDVGIDYSGPIEIYVSDGTKEKTYHRTVSHFGKRNGERLNEFLIVDKDFDNTEDAFDSEITPLTNQSYDAFSEIKANETQLANPITKKVNRDIIVRPPVPNKPVNPPTQKNPIVILEKKIKELETRVSELVEENSKLVNEKSLVLSENKLLTTALKTAETEIAELKQEVLTNSINMRSSLSRIVALEQLVSDMNSERTTLLAQISKLESLNVELKKSVETHKSENSSSNEKISEKSAEIKNLNSKLRDFNSTIATMTVKLDEFNSTIIDLSNKLKVEQNTTSVLTSANTQLTDENSALTQTIEKLRSQLDTAIADKSDMTDMNSRLQDEVGVLTIDNLKLMTIVDKSNSEITQLTSELEEAIRVAQVPFISGWFYDPKNGWLYTDAESYPLIYKQSTSSWHFYELGSHAPKYFYSYEKDLWEEWK